MQNLKGQVKQLPGMSDSRTLPMKSDGGYGPGATKADAPRKNSVERGFPEALVAEIDRTLKRMTRNSKRGELSADYCARRRRRILSVFREMFAQGHSIVRLSGITATGLQHGLVGTGTDKAASEVRALLKQAGVKFDEFPRAMASPHAARQTPSPEVVASVIAAVRDEDSLVGLYVDIVRNFGISLIEVAYLRPGKDFRQGALHVIRGSTRSIHRGPIPVDSDEKKRTAQLAIETATHYNGFLRPRGIQAIQMTRRVHNVFRKHAKEGVRLDDLRRHVVMDADLADAALCVQLLRRIEARLQGMNSAQLSILLEGL